MLSDALLRALSNKIWVLSQVALRLSPACLPNVASQVTVLARLRAFATLLQLSLQAEEAGGAMVPARAPLPRLAVVFVTTALKVGCCGLLSPLSCCTV
jgi:hypothetical protein